MKEQYTKLQWKEQWNWYHQRESIGNHIKITNGDVTTLYAHCKTIYVKEGDIIIQGQNLGEVGSTGNSTGPHLHFEIRRNNEYVDPDLILDF